MQKLSYLNYKIMDKKVKVFVVQSNRLKKSYNETLWSFENTVALGGKLNNQLQKRPLMKTWKYSRGPSEQVMNANRKLSKCKPWGRKTTARPRYPSAWKCWNPRYRWKQNEANAWLLCAGSRLWTPKFSALQKRVSHNPYCTTLNQESCQATVAGETPPL